MHRSLKYLKCDPIRSNPNQLKLNGFKYEFMNMNLCRSDSLTCLLTNFGIDAKFHQGKIMN